MAELGLRARKRLAAMRHIQATAFDLFERDGFGGVTIEQIARTAEVSPSSVYRYFGTKEQLVLWDEYDPAAFGLFAEELQGYPPLDAMRRAVDAVGETFLGPDRERIERMVNLAYEEPSVHAAMGQQLAEAAQAIAAMIGARYDRDPHDLEIQVVATTLVGAIEVSFRHWHRCGFERPLVDLMDEAFGLLARGLEL